MTPNEYQEMQVLILVVNRTIENINKEINKLPKDYIENHLEKLCFLGDDVLRYTDNSKNGKFRTWDAILIQRPFSHFFVINAVFNGVVHLEKLGLRLMMLIFIMKK